MAVHSIYEVFMALSLYLTCMTFVITPYKQVIVKGLWPFIRQFSFLALVSHNLHVKF